jgi:hypothetical protein
MENPLELPAPNDPIERVHTLARDLAYGVANGMWGTKIGVMSSSDGESWANWTTVKEGTQTFWNYLKRKWNNNQPSVDLMLSFEYLVQDQANEVEFKAFIYGSS